MNPKHEILLKLLNKIDENIIVRNSMKRYELMHNTKKAKKKNFIPIIAIAAAVAILMSLALFILVPLFGTKQVPIYTGMTVSNPAQHSAYGGAAVPLSASDTVVLHRPISGKIIKYYESSDDVFSDNMSDNTSHLGIDVSASEGTPVYSAASGTVYKIWVDPHMGYCMAISHGNNTRTVYKHLSQKFADGIVEGVNVKARQIIASVGSVEAESADVSHLHFEVIVDDLYVDPLKYFSKDDLNALGVDDSYFESETESDMPENEPQKNKICYANPGDDVFFTIHFENPDNYTIMAFTLNGVPYASYMFEYGSNYENIIIRVNVGDVEGLVDYTIDAIQYADRDTLKYVEMKGDPTVILGVSTAKQPVATVTDEVIDINEMSFKVNVTDELELIKLTEGKLYAVITDGETLVDSKEINVSELTEIKFENLKTSTNYCYSIVAEYDALDGKGFTSHILYSKEITTREVVSFTNVSADKTSIDFSLLFNENAKTKEIKAIELYLGENKVKDIDITATEITDLLSNTEYKLVVCYTNRGETESTSYTVKTLAKAPPKLELSQKGESTQTSFEFDIAFTDADSAGKITKIELLHGEDEPIVAENLDVRTFEDLLSNNEYIVKVTVIYDLNDGEGEHTETATLNIKTKAKLEPKLELSQKGESTQTSFEFGLTYTDIDAVGEITKLELLHGEDEPINIEDLNTRTFTELLSNNEYTVKVTFVYDLNDGKGEQTSTEELTVKTLTKVAPQIGFKVAKENKTSIEYLLSVIDPDGVYSQVDLYITDADGNRLSNQAAENIFSGLTPATRYYIILKYSYDLNDGNGVHEEEIKNFSITDINPEFISATNLTDRINSGESVTATFKFSEIENVKIKAITINGQKVTLSKASNTYVATFIPDISGGKYDFKITAIEYEIFDITKTHICDIDTGVSVVVFGEIKIVGVSLSNGKNYIESGENGVVGYIDFEDSEGYTVTSFRCQEKEFTSNYKTVYLTKVTDTRYSFSVPYNESAIIFELNYEIEDDSTTKSGYSVGFSFYSFDTTNITEISTPEQLMAITETGKYKLTADINMTGYEWIPKNFDGYLDGNGYKIENLVISPKLVTPEGDYRTDAYCAMFAKMGGVLRNIELTNVTINYTTPDIPIYDAYVAALAGYNSGIIINCNVSGDFYLLDFFEPQYMTSYTSAICGRSFGIIDSCTYNGTVISQYNISFGEICDFSERYGYWLIKETCTGNCEIIILNDE